MITIRQVKTKKSSTSAIIRSAAFVRGFNEVKKGIALVYDAYPPDANKQWDYERGRLFGLRFHGALKTGAKVNYSAAVMLGVEFHNKSLI